MKKNLLFLFLFNLVFIPALLAQTPNAFQYQAVLRNNAGEILKDQSVTVRFLLRKGSAFGTAVFSETHSATSNASGYVSLQIGMGTPGTGSLTLGEIDWTSGAYFMQVDLDSGSGYSTLSVQQLLSIPYAKYSQSASSLKVKSPDGSLWTISIGDDGKIVATKVQ